ncbi:MAG TPA: bluetail domain-containing putative surface protein [Rhizomicrobium sp.]
MKSNDAVFFHAGDGDYSGKGFLVVDFNGEAGYQAGQDLVIQIDAQSFGLSDFTNS